jgi:hypothetical protein
LKAGWHLQTIAPEYTSALAAIAMLVIVTGAPAIGQQILPGFSCTHQILFTGTGASPNLATIRSISFRNFPALVRVRT